MIKVIKRPEGYRTGFLRTKIGYYPANEYRVGLLELTIDISSHVLSASLRLADKRVDPIRYKASYDRYLIKNDYVRLGLLGLYYPVTMAETFKTALGYAGFVALIRGYGVFLEMGKRHRSIYTLEDL